MISALYLKQFNMRLRQQIELLNLKNEALTAYLDFCIKHDEVPRDEQIILINNCSSSEALKGVIVIIKSR